MDRVKKLKEIKLKILIFYFLAIFVIPGGLFFSIEYGLYLAGYPLYVQKDENMPVLDIQQCRYGQRFLKQYCVFDERKIDLTKKNILLLGGSTAAGYPDYYGSNFGNMIHDSFGKENYNVVNHGASCRDSSFVSKCFKAALQVKFDMVIIYSGHNDYTNSFHPHSFPLFAQSFPWIFDFITSFRFRSRIFSYFSVLFRPETSSGNYTIENQREYEERHRFVENKLKSSYQSILETARKMNTRLVVVTPVSNLTEFKASERKLKSPFFKKKLEESIGFYKEGYSFWRKKDLKTALFKFKEAVNTDPVPSRFTSRATHNLKNQLVGDNVLLIDFQKFLDDEFMVSHKYGCDLFGKEGSYCDQFHLNQRGHVMLFKLLFKGIRKKWPDF